tara:strand:+ start:7884 stop:8099 length:216 start_codon:yes stop_codon:yes gene_type:complete
MKIKSISKKEIELYEKTYKAIVSMYENTEMTMKEIGDEFDITKQRVWQIITKVRKGNGDYYYEHRNKSDRG